MIARAAPLASRIPRSTVVVPVLALHFSARHLNSSFPVASVASASNAPVTPRTRTLLLSAHSNLNRLRPSRNGFSNLTRLFTHSRAEFVATRRQNGADITASAAKFSHRASEEYSNEDESKPPAASGPTKTVKIFCAKCQQQLYRYRKGGNGALVKCFVERIAEDFTAGDMKCPACGSEFARMRMIKGKPAHKIVGGKVFMRK